MRDSKFPPLKWFAGVSLFFLAAPVLALQGSEWQPLRLNGNGLSEPNPIYLQFRSKQRLEGFGGCNRLFAEYRVEGGNLFIGPVMTTRGLCKPDVMARERALTAALQSARSFQREQMLLTIYDAGGKVVLYLRQTDWD